MAWGAKQENYRALAPLLVKIFKEPALTSGIELLTQNWKKNTHVEVDMVIAKSRNKIGLLQ